MNATLKIRTHQDSLGLWRAIIDDAEGNTLAAIPNDFGPGYGFSTEAQARTAAENFISQMTAISIDIAGGGPA